MQQTMVDSIRNIPALSRRTYRVEEIADILEIGRSSAYNLVKQGYPNLTAS